MLDWLAKYDNFIHTGLIIGTGFIFNWVTSKGISRLDLEVDKKRNLVVVIRNILFIIVVLGVLAVWAKELKTVALSVAAVGAGLILVSKEAILNLLGGFARASSKAASVGDRVVLNGITGIVMDHTLFSTTLLEVGSSGQIQGSIAIVPNAVYLTSPLRNLSATGDYILKTVTVPIKPPQDIVGLSDTLEEAAKEVMAPYLEEAKEHLVYFSNKALMEMPSVEPLVLIQPYDKETVHLVLRVALPYGKQMLLEQLILRKFYERIHAKALLKKA